MALQHNPKIVTDGLVLCLDAGNPLSYSGSGTAWNDLSGNGNNGTLTNGPTYSSDNKGNIICDGIDDVIISSNNTNISGDFNATLSIWVNFISVSSNWNCAIQFGDVGSVQGFAIFQGGDWGSSALVVGFYGGKAGYITNSITDNVWTNLVATKTSGAIGSTTTKLYKNGQSLSLTFNSSLIPNASNDKLRIGNDQANENANIKVGSAMLYNRALTASEVLQNYNATKGRYAL